VQIVPTERWQQIEALFSEALQQPAGMRTPFVEDRCDDAGMRDDVMSLLRAADQAGSFLSDPALDVFSRQISREGWSVRAGDRVAAYTILERLGAGGMGEVWRARDERLGRDVAIKLLLPHASEVAARVAAFAGEARAAGALNHPNVLTVFDVGEHRGAPYLVTEFLEGRPLRARLVAGALPLDEALDVALQSARGLRAAHAHGIVHRDLKPDNIFLMRDGRVKLLDFGLATLRAPEPDMTVAGPQFGAAAQAFAGGTAGYMAPEQMRGEPVDARADIFALGAVLHEMVVGAPRFRSKAAAGAVNVTLTQQPREQSDLAPGVPRTLSQIVRRCVDPVPANRFSAVHEVISALESVVRDLHPPPAPRVSALLRRPAVVLTLILILVAAGVSSWRWRAAAARARWAATIAVPEINRLASHGDFAAAFVLAREALDAVPDDPQVRQLWIDVSMVSNVTTDPAGADVAIGTYRTPPARWLSLGRTPLRDVRIPRGLARLRILKEGFQAVEGTLHPQPEIRFRLGSARSAPDGMVRVTGGIDSVRFGAVGAIDDFWIDRFEVTNRQFKAFVDAGGYRERDYWREPFLDGDTSLTWEAAIERFRDRTGRPGPATWIDGTYAEGEADFPVGGLSWYEAEAYARFAGKSLPTMYHWYRAADLGRFADILPLSNFNGSGAAPVGQHAGLGPFGTYDMAGNVKEWCWNAIGDQRLLLGGAWNESRYMFAARDARLPFERAATFGIRLAKYDQPLTAEHPGAMQTSPEEREFPPRQPVSEEIFEIYRRQYAYDRVPLNAVVEATADTPLWRRLTVTFDAAYGAERVRAHLFLPHNAVQPYQTVIFFPGHDAFQLRSSVDMALGSAELIVQSGRAFLYPVYKGTYERHAPEPAGENGHRELHVAWSRDLGRSIDYLESRADIDHNRLAFYGLSAGGDAGIILTAIESRLKASVLQGTGLWDEPTSEIDPRNYAPRITVPTLMVNGRYDFLMPFETTQRSLFELLGVSSQHKRHVVLETGHAVPPADRAGVILPWLDRYLGPVR
jgi:dienelactone hydrolase